MTAAVVHTPYPESDRRIVRAALIMCEALAEDPLWGPWVASANPFQHASIRLLTVTYMAEAVRAGWLRLSPDLGGVMCWVGPGSKGPSLVERMAERALAPCALGRDRQAVLSLFHEMSAVRADLPPHVYAVFLGVLPESRQRGVGSSLAAEGLSWAAMNRVPVYLEAFTESNKDLYERAGFMVVRRFSAPRGVTGYGMLRNVGSTVAR